MEDFIKTINIYDYERFRSRVIEACQVTRTTWSNWRNGASITEKYKPIIDRVALDMFGKAVFTKKP